MLQRKQTLFFIVAVLLLTITLFTYFIKNEYVYFNSFNLKIYKNGAENSFFAFPIAIYLIINILITFFTIFIFKRRNAQIRFTIFSIIISIGFYGLLFYYHFWIKKHTSIEFSMYNYSLVSPLLAAVFEFLALNGIKSDEKLIRESNRIR